MLLITFSASQPAPTSAGHAVLASASHPGSHMIASRLKINDTEHYFAAPANRASPFRSCARRPKFGGASSLVLGRCDYD